MMQADNEKEEHLMCVICEFEDSCLIYKIFVVGLIVDCHLSALKIFSKYEQRCFIKIQNPNGKNAQQCLRALLEA